MSRERQERAAPLVSQSRTSEVFAEWKDGRIVRLLACDPKNPYRYVDVTEQIRGLLAPPTRSQS